MLYLTSEDVAVLTTVTLYSFLGDVITNCNKLTDSFVLITSCLCDKGTHLSENGLVWSQFFLPPLGGFQDQSPVIRLEQ